MSNPYQKIALIAVAALGAVCTIPAYARAQDPPASTASQSETIGPAKGTLFIVGGGAMGAKGELWDRFIELAGGPNAHIVVIPTAGEGADTTLDPRTTSPQALKSRGVTNVTVLHTRDRKEADSEKFVEPLRSANAVWFDGGRQWHLADSYLDTRTEKELFAVLDRGGVIGGSSAGATIQGSYLVRGDTKGAEIVEGDHTVGFGFLKNSAIDQHILVRNRQFDLIPLIEKHPELLGIGINESTAIIVHGNQFEVAGASYVAITDSTQWTSTNSISPNQAAQKGKLYFLAKGQKFDLSTRTPIIPRRSRTTDVAAGGGAASADGKSPQ